MKITQVECPHCGTPIFSRDIDLAILCKDCGRLHTREGIPLTIDYEAGVFLEPGDGDRVYLPFWVLSVAYHISDIDNKELLGFLHTLAGADITEDGTILMFVPAFALEPSAFKEMAMDMIARPPTYKAGMLEPGFRRIPAIMSQSQAKKLADFLFVTKIAERPGVLQGLDYRLDIRSVKLLYLLCYANGSQFQSDRYLPDGPTYAEMGAGPAPGSARPFDFSADTVR